MPDLNLLATGLHEAAATTPIDPDAVEKTSAYTVLAGDVGKTFYVTESVAFTLPAIADYLIYKFVYLGEDGAAALTISPNAVDGIGWDGNATDNKDIVLTASTAKKGDYVVIGNPANSVAAWQVLDVRGTWDKEA